MYKKCLLVLLTFGFGSSAYADFVVVIGNKNGSPVQFAAGDANASIGVWAYNSNALAPMSLASYQLEFDFGNDGTGIPGSPDYFTSPFADFSNRGAPLTPAFEASSDALPDLTTGDLAVISLGGSDALMPTSLAGAVKLFDIKFGINVATPGGDYDLVLNGIKLISGTGTAGRTIRMENTAGAFNKFTVTAVPDPASFALVGIGMAGFAGVRRWRKRKVAAAVAC